MNLEAAYFEIGVLERELATPVVPLTPAKKADRSLADTSGSEFMWEGMKFAVTAAMSHYSVGLDHGAALRASFKLHYGLDPMQNPRLDCEFLDLLDLASTFPPEVNEADFYDHL